MKKYKIVSDSTKSLRIKHLELTEKYLRLKKSYDDLEETERMLFKPLDGYVKNNNNMNNITQQLADELIVYIKNTQKDLALLHELNRIIFSQQTQISYLKQENNQYRSKLSLITDTWYGKFAIMCYRKLNKVRIIQRILGG